MAMLDDGTMLLDHGLSCMHKQHDPRLIFMSLARVCFSYCACSYGVEGTCRVTAL